MVAVTDVIKALAGMEANPRAIREIGAELARGMQQGGNARSFSSMNPTGEDTGVAGGRGASSKDRFRSESQFIKSEQLRTEVNRKVFNSYKKLNKQLDHVRSTYKEYQDDVAVFAKAFGKEWGDAMDKVESSSRVQARLMKNLQAVGIEDIKTTEDLLELRERHAKLEQKLLNAKGTELATLSREHAEYKKLSKAMATATKGIDSTGDKLHSYMSMTATRFFTLESAAAQLSLTFGRLMNDMAASMKFGARTNFAGVMQDQWNALKTGMDPAAYTEMSAQARQAAYQFDSMGQFSEKLGERQREYYGYIGDTAEAAQFATNTFNTLGKAGIDPTSNAFDHLGQTFLYLNKAAGVTADQFNQMQETLLADENIQVRLRAASTKERAAIMAGINQRLKENVAIGMSTEKSLEAARAMGRIAGGDARERFKQAAMAQMTLGAMGIEGGQRAGDLIRKGQRMTDPERKELQRIMGNASQFMAETKTGGIGTEIAFGTMMQKSGLDQYMGPNSPFNVTLEKQLALGREDNAAILQQLKEGPGVLSDVKFWTDIVKNGIMESPIISAIGGVAAAVGAAYAGSRILGGMRAGKGIMGSIGSIFGRGAPKVAGAAGRGLMATVGGTLAAATSAAYGTYQAGQAITTGRSDIHDWMTGEGGTGLGNWISEKLGAALHGDFAAVFGEEEKAARELEKTHAVEASRQRETQTETIAHQLTEQQKTNEYLRLLVEVNSEAVGREGAMNRITQLQNGMMAPNQR